MFRIFGTDAQGTRMVRLDPTGTVLDPGGGVAVDVSDWAYGVACLPDGRCGLALNGNVVAVVDASGVVLGEVPLIVKHGKSSPDGPVTRG